MPLAVPDDTSEIDANLTILGMGGGRRGGNVSPRGIYKPGVVVDRRTTPAHRTIALPGLLLHRLRQLRRALQQALGAQLRLTFLQRRPLRLSLPLLPPTQRATLPRRRQNFGRGR